MSPTFDDKFIEIIIFPIDDRYYEMMSWINNNSSESVDIKINETDCYIAFQNFDDALYFKIRYPR